MTDADRRYREDRSAESQTEYARVLRAFADLVLRDEIPEE
jgi:hypothetical protein